MSLEDLVFMIKMQFINRGLTQTTKIFCLGDVPRQKFHVRFRQEIICYREAIGVFASADRGGKYLRLSSEAGGYKK